MTKIIEKTCMICFSIFETKSKYVKCCGKVCSKKLQQLTKYGVKEEKPITPCETCGITPEKKYSTGRFCSKKCACRFSTSHAREKISEKTSQTLKNKYHKDEATPCEKCGIIPETKHESGRWCIDCAYLTSQIMLEKRLEKSKKVEVKEKVPKKKGPDIGKFLSKQRKDWEAGDRKNLCDACSQPFEVAWDKRHIKTCSKTCYIKNMSNKMIQRNIDGNFFQSFGRRVKYTNYGQDIHCDSLIEWCALEDFFQKYGKQIISATRSEYKIPYIDENGNQRSYNPDFDIVLSNGERFCVECKSEQFGLNETWSRYQKEATLKKELLETFCKDNGITSVWFTQKTRKDLYCKLKESSIKS